jgi:hypothetical protein
VFATLAACVRITVSPVAVRFVALPFTVRLFSLP